MKTLKIFTFTLLMISLFACEDLNNLASKEFTGTAPTIDFTTSESSNMASAQLKAPQKTSEEGYEIYNKEVSTDFINEKIEELNLSKNVIKTFDITSVELTLPEADITTALLFLGVKFYIGDKLVAQNNMTTISGGTTAINLTIVDKDVLASIKDSESFTVRIVNMQPVPDPTRVVLKYKYNCKVSLL